MKFLILIVLAIAIYGAAESKPAVEVNLDDGFDAFLKSAGDLGISDLSIPDIDLKVGEAAEVSLTNIKVENLELLVRKGDIIADLASLTAGVTAEVDVVAGFEKPVEITADASVKVLVLPVDGSLDATITDLVSYADAVITLVDDGKSFTVEIKEFGLNDTKIDIDLEVAGIEADLLSEIVSQLSTLLQSTLNDVVAVSLKDILNAALSGQSFPLGV